MARISTGISRCVGRLQGRIELIAEGHTKLFFELNGQVRLIRIDRAGAARSASRLRAEEGNAQHVGAAMPGMVLTVAAKPGHKVAKGGPLPSLEAMKMETMIRAERDLVIRQVHVKPGSVVKAKDLLIECDA